MTPDVTEARAVVAWYDARIEAPYLLDRQMQRWCMDALGPTNMVLPDGRRRWIRIQTGHRHPSLVRAWYCFALVEDVALFGITWLDDTFRWTSSHEPFPMEHFS